MQGKGGCVEEQKIQLPKDRIHAFVLLLAKLQDLFHINVAMVNLVA